MTYRIRILSFLFPVALGAATLTVNSTDDLADLHPGDGVCVTSAGTCSLRAAIQESNALPGMDTIAFAIGAGAVTISPASGLPTITDPVVIDATTQPGYAGAPLIELSGLNAKGNTNGLKITAGGSSVLGLIVNNWFAAGISIGGSGGNVIQGNYVGIDATGTVAKANRHNGILIQSPNNLIGGTTVAARNVISGNLDLGGLVIYGVSATGNTVQGNFIGTDATGTVAIANFGRGIAVKGAPNNLIGGTVPGARNLISGNQASGIRVFASSDGTVIQGNYVGTDVSGQTLVNNSRGIQTRSNNTLIGGSEPGAGNLVEGGTDGIEIAEGASSNTVQGNTVTKNGIGVHVVQGAGNAILGNSIYGNQQLGIDLNPLGVTPNDLGDFDTGANNLQNFPVLNTAAAGTSTTVGGTLNSAASTSFTLEFFSNPACDPSGYGEGRTFLGQSVVTTDSTGNVSFTANLPHRSAVGNFVTATATDPGGNTSEFAACVTVGSAVAGVHTR